MSSIHIRDRYGLNFLIFINVELRIQSYAGQMQVSVFEEIQTPKHYLMEVCDEHRN